MGVTCDKFIGYSMDIKDEWENARKRAEKEGREDEYDDLWCGFGLPKNKRLKELRFIPFYAIDRANPINGCLTIIDDGMCGEYTKIFYIEFLERDANEDSGGAVAFINQKLSMNVVPKEVEERMRKIYSMATGLNSTGKLIKPEYLLHYH